MNFTISTRRRISSKQKNNTVIIELSSNGLTITDAENTLSSIHSSQLQYWGFKKTKDLPRSFSLDSSESRANLGKVADFFEQEKLPFSFGPNCQKLIDEIRFNATELVRVRKIGQSIKNGKFDKKQFEQFKLSLQSCTKRDLKEHQFRAAYHLYLTENGANFSVPGSGKTSVVLAIYEKLRKEGKVNR